MCRRHLKNPVRLSPLWLCCSRNKAQETSPRERRPRRGHRSRQRHQKNPKASYSKAAHHVAAPARDDREFDPCVHRLSWRRRAMAPVTWLPGRLRPSRRPRYICSSSVSGSIECTAEMSSTMSSGSCYLESQGASGDPDRCLHPEGPVRSHRGALDPDEEP
jgi:hypothetical protein